MIDRFALLIGAMKSGTSLFFNYVQQHPEVCCCRKKEPNVLTRPTDKPLDFPSYCSMFPWDSDQHKWGFEASTAYAQMPVQTSPAVLTLSLPAEFRFLYLVRNPIGRIRSHYLHALAVGTADVPICDDLAALPIIVSNYRLQLEPYVAAHGRDAIHVMRYEDLTADFRTVMHGAAQFLDLGDFEFEYPGPRNSSGHYRRKLLCTILREMGLEAAIVRPGWPRIMYEKYRELLVESLSELGAVDALEAAEAELVRRITPSDAQVNRIHELLDKDLESFQDEWGIDPWADDRRESEDVRAEYPEPALVKTPPAP